MIIYLVKIKSYKNRVNTLRMESIEASMFVTNESLDFVFIDANHVFRNVILDMGCWVRKVKRGGIISGHDYIDYNKSGMANPSNYDVKVAVDKIFPKATIQGQVWWVIKGEGRVWEKWAGV